MSLYAWTHVRGFVCPRRRFARRLVCDHMACTTRGMRNTWHAQHVACTARTARVRRSTHRGDGMRARQGGGGRPTAGAGGGLGTAPGRRCRMGTRRSASLHIINVHSSPHTHHALSQDALPRRVTPRVCGRQSGTRCRQTGGSLIHRAEGPLRGTGGVVLSRHPEATSRACGG